jgi:hypothetical protein
VSRPRPAETAWQREEREWWDSLTWRAKLRFHWAVRVQHPLMRAHGNALRWIAFRVPRPIAYWVFVRMAASDGGPGDRTCIEVMKQHKDWVR